MKLIMDPAGHCSQGDYSWPSARTGIHDDISYYLYLRESNLPIPAELEARYNEADVLTFYVMGGDGSVAGNYWTTIPAWPTVSAANYYLAPNGILQTTAPTSGAVAPLSYTYDPANPVPSIGGTELLIPCGPRDQTELEGRSDILWFTAPAFTANTAIVGELSATLWVSTDRNDTDFTVKLVDLYPDGRNMLLQDGIARLRWRNGGETPQLAVPGQVYQLRIKIARTAYVFEPGHALRVAISSSNDPRFDVNPNSGEPIRNGGPTYVAQNTVYLDSTRPSYVTLPVVPLASLPRNFNP